MSIIKKIILLSILIPIIFISNSLAEDLKKVGKFKDWEVMVISEASGKVCFAQSTPVLQAPKKNKRDARLFITFRPSEKISDEISASSGYEFNKDNSVIATSGKNKIKFDIKQQGFAWIADNKVEKKMVKLMKKGSRIMITGYNKPNAEKAIEAYYEVAKKYKLDLAQMSLKFLEIQPFVTSVIIGATTMEQLKTDIESVNIKLTEEIINEINEVQKIYPNPCP